MPETKHYVYSARTTEDGLAVLNKAKGDRSWDDFISQAMAAHYNLDLNVIGLPPSKFLAERQAAKEQKAKEKAERAAKREAEKKAKAEAKKVADKAKAARAQRAADRKAGVTVKKVVKVTAKVAAAKGTGVKATKKPALVS
jgi:FKBP-type peptidyl-prolyl cis-trans isomerase